jgi:hypothetical protein
MPIEKRQKKSRKSKIKVPSNKQTKVILRTLPDSQAFYFYSEINKPTNQIARSLVEFYDIINSNQSHQKQALLKFHMERDDFVKWIKEAIRDTELADKLSKISSKDPRLEKKLNKVIKDRINQLRDNLVEYSIIPEDNYATVYTNKR